MANICLKGGWWQKGKLSDQTLNEFNSQLIDNVTSHFLVYKTFAKDLAKQPGSTYSMILLLQLFTPDNHY